MKYASIDIETTGLNSELCQILSIGIILEDSTRKLPREVCPQLHLMIIHDMIVGQPYAINLNQDIIGQLAKPETRRKDVQYIHLGMVSRVIAAFLTNHEMDPMKLTVAGKNFGTFDKKFLENIPKWSSFIGIKQRLIDPSILFVDWERDEELPNLKTCKDRAGIIGSVTHDAIDDAWDVIELLRTQY